MNATKTEETKTMQTPTVTAIETAIRRADAMHGVYSCEPIPGLPGRFYVQHEAEPTRCYLVDIRPGKQRCSCPQFEKAAVCKHGAFAHQAQRIREGEEMNEARHLGL